jgi:hypothetical protein
VLQLSCYCSVKLLWNESANSNTLLLLLSSQAAVVQTLTQQQQKWTHAYRSQWSYVSCLLCCALQLQPELKACRQRLKLSLLKRSSSNNRWYTGTPAEAPATVATAVARAAAAAATAAAAVQRCASKWTLNSVCCSVSSAVRRRFFAPILGARDCSRALAVPVCLWFEAGATALQWQQQQQLQQRLLCQRRALSAATLLQCDEQ